MSLAIIHVCRSHERHDPPHLEEQRSFPQVLTEYKITQCLARAYPNKTPSPAMHTSAQARTRVSYALVAARSNQSNALSNNAHGDQSFTQTPCKKD